jgi:hypothetical protein
MQMSLLGALLTFSPRALFPVHLLTTAPWGLSPLEDQQIGGLIMWIPAGVLLLGYALTAFGPGGGGIYPLKAPNCPTSRGWTFYKMAMNVSTK